ncbi:TrmH family RNA methyltransferase [Patescibacteria group bacterium]
MALKRYQKKLNYSYTLGIFPTLELLTHQPDKTIRVLVSSRINSGLGIAKIKNLCQKNNLPFLTADRQLEKLSPKDNCYCLGVFKKYVPSLESQKNHLVLVNPRDAGNLGTICRTMLGFGWQNLALIKPAVDIFHPKVIRASMGAIFQMNFFYFSSFADYQKKFTHQFYPLMTNAQKKLKDVSLQKPFTLVFGNEGAGLEPKFSQIGTPLKISQTEKIDSLNLAIAVGITLYEVSS